MEIRRYIENGIRYVEDVCPDGWTCIADYTPCSTVTPWDYYGMCWCRERQRALQEAGIQGDVCETRKTILNPRGSGPRGSVRFGDNMLPHDYHLIVKAEDASRAIIALSDHKQAVSDWLDGKRPMPAACRG